MESYNNHEPRILIHTPRASNIHTPPPPIRAHPSNCVVPSHWLALSLAEYGLWSRSTLARRGRVHILREQRLCWLGGATRQEACVHRVEIGMYSQLISGCSGCLELEVIIYATWTPFSQSSRCTTETTTIRRKKIHYNTRRILVHSNHGINDSLS